MLKVLGKHASINVRKVLWTLDELGLQAVLEPFGAGHAPTCTDEFLALNPNGLVPVLVDDDFVLWESNTICRYLAARERRHDLLPEPARDRARVEQWMDWQATDLNSAWRVAFMALMRGNLMQQGESAVQASVSAWNRHMAILDRQLQATRAYVAGPAFTLADVVIGLSVHRWLQTPIERPRLPAVADYHDRLQARPGFRSHAIAGLA